MQVAYVVVVLLWYFQVVRSALSFFTLVEAICKDDTAYDIYYWIHNCFDTEESVCTKIVLQSKVF